MYSASSPTTIITILAACLLVVSYIKQCIANVLGTNTKAGITKWRGKLIMAHIFYVPLLPWAQNVLQRIVLAFEATHFGASGSQKHTHYVHREH